MERGKVLHEAVQATGRPVLGKHSLQRADGLRALFDIALCGIAQPIWAWAKSPQPELPIIVYDIDGECILVQAPIPLRPQLRRGCQTSLM